MAEEGNKKDSESQKTIDDLAREIRDSEQPEKSIDELAREAMKAIKESKQKNERQGEREAKLKQEKLKQEAQNRIKSKLRRLESDQKKEERKEDIKEAIESRFMVDWENPDEKGIRHEGIYNDKTVFRISRGINLFHLFILGDEILVEEWKRKSHTSISLHSLKEKADKILKESNKKLEEIEIKTKGMVLLSKQNYKSKDGFIKEGVKIRGKYYAPKNDV